MDLLEVLRTQRATLSTEEDAIVAQATEAGSLDDEQRGRLDVIHTEITQVDADFARESARQTHVRTAPAALVEGPITPLGEPSAIVDMRSIGQQFVDSEAWQRQVAKAGAGGFLNSRRVESDKVEFANILPRRKGAALLTGGGATSAGAFVLPDQLGFVDEALQRPLSIRDVITTGTTGSDSVEYVRITGFTNGAAIVPEADSTDPTDTTGLKPESGLAFLRINELVKTIAHWVPATKRALSDAGQLRTIVDSFLRYGLALELEEQIISGDASGDNFDGLLHVSGTQTQAFVTDNITTSRKAKTKVRIGGQAVANAYLFHPNDWERLDLEMTMNGGGSNYRQASEQTQPRLWGLRVVESEAVPEGTGIVGDFTKIVLWDREQTSIQVSDGVNNFFLKNLVAILAELRAAMGIIRPAAFVKFTVQDAGS